MGQEQSAEQPEKLDACQKALEEIDAAAVDDYKEWDDDEVANRLNEAANCFELALAKIPDDERKKYVRLDATKTPTLHQNRSIYGTYWPQPNRATFAFDVKLHATPMTEKFYDDELTLRRNPAADIKISAWTHLLADTADSMNELSIIQQMRKKALNEIKDRIPDEKVRTEWLKNGDGSSIFEYLFNSRSVPAKRLHALPQPKRTRKRKRTRSKRKKY